jgi:hypothetical protein
MYCHPGEIHGTKLLPGVVCTYRTIAKVVALGEVASVLWVPLLFQRKVEVCLPNVILALYLFLP